MYVTFKPDKKGRLNRGSYQVTCHLRTKHANLAGKNTPRRKTISFGNNLSEVDCLQRCRYWVTEASKYTSRIAHQKFAAPFKLLPTAAELAARIPLESDLEQTIAQKMKGLGSGKRPKNAKGFAKTGALSTSSAVVAVPLSMDMSEMGPSSSASSSSSSSKGKGGVGSDSSVAGSDSGSVSDGDDSSTSD